jgi:hypothetical protein
LAESPQKFPGREKSFLPGVMNLKEEELSLCSFIGKDAQMTRKAKRAPICLLIV